MKVTLRNIEGHRALTYTYTPTPGVTCQFHLLCEVGEPWQAEARALAVNHAYCRKGRIVQVELEAAPWLVDAIVVNHPSPEQLEALEAFKQRHGRDWKRKLNDAWLDGRDAYEPSGHLLRQIRNQFGPQWLVSYRSAS